MERGGGLGVGWAMRTGSNNPPVTIELDDEMAAFVEENCDANIAFALNALQSVSRETAEKLVVQLEKFKRLRELVRDGRG